MLDATREAITAMVDRLGRLLEDLDGAVVGHLVDDRGERDPRAGHLGEERGPDAAGDDDVLGLDGAAAGRDALDAAVLDAHRGDLGVRERGQGAHRLGLLAAQGPELQGVADADARGVEAADEDALVDERDQLLDLGRGDQAGVDAPVLRGVDLPSELVHARLGTRDLEAAALGVDVPLLVLARALQRELRHLLVVVGEVQEVGGVAGGAAGVRERALVDEHDVPPAEAGEVVRDAVADDAGTDDHDLRACRKAAHERCSCGGTGHETRVSGAGGAGPADARRRVALLRSCSAEKQRAICHEDDEVTRALRHPDDRSPEANC